MQRSRNWKRSLSDLLPLIVALRVEPATPLLLGICRRQIGWRWLIGSATVDRCLTYRECCCGMGTTSIQPCVAEPEMSNAYRWPPVVSALKQGERRHCTAGCGNSGSSDCAEYSDCSLRDHLKASRQARFCSKTKERDFRPAKQSQPAGVA